MDAMDMSKLGTAFTIAMVIYVIILIAIGFYMTKKQDKGTVLDWFAAGSALPAVGIGLIMAAAWLDISTVFINFDWAFDIGFSAFWILVAYEMCAFVFIALWIAKKVKNVRFLSQPEMLEARYGEAISPLYSIIWIISLTGYGAMSFMVFQQTFLWLFGIHPAVSGLICIAILISYQGISGMTSTAYADYFNCLAAVIVGIALGVITMNAAGGLSVINTATPSNLLNPLDFGLFNIFVYSLALIPAFVIEPTAWMRVKAAKSVKAASRGFLIAFLIFIPVSIFTIYGGVAGRLVLPNWEGPGTYPLPIELILELTGPTVAAFMLVGVMAALVSSMGAFLFAANLSLCYDLVPFIYRKTTRKQFPDKWIRNTSRLGILVIGILATYMGMAFPDLVQLLLFSATIASAGLFFPVIAMLYWRRATMTGAMLGLLVGAGTAIIWNVLGSPLGLHPILISMPLSFICVVGGSYLTKPPSEEQLKPFFGNGEELEEDVA